MRRRSPGRPGRRPARAQHQQRGPGHHRDRHRDERGAPAGERGFGRGWSAEQVGGAGQHGDHPGSDAEGGVADIERVEQRASCGRGGAHGEPADHAADGGQAGNDPRRAPGARDRERGAGRVERQHERRGPQPARWRVIAGAGRSSSTVRPPRTIGMVRSSPANACCWSSMRVSPSRNHAPSTRSGRAELAASVVVGLRADGQPRVAGRAFGDRLTQVGQSGIGSRGQPQPGEGLADHPVAAATGHVGCPAPTLPHGPKRWETHRTWPPNSSACRRA